MKTTIIPANREPRHQNAIFLTGLHLLLALSYLATLLLLATTPVRHGAWMGAGMGNAPNLSLSFLYIPLSLLIIVHLIALSPSRLPRQAGLAAEVCMLVSAMITLTLLLLVRQYASILSSIHPVPAVLLGSLALSSVLGLYLVLDRLRQTPAQRRGFGEDNGLPPLPANRYRNLRILTEGGTGTIWYAERIEDDLPVVVKVPRKDDEMVGISFMQEISLWRELEHPHIATIISANILPVPYIEIEYLPGSLAEMKKPLSPEEAVPLIRSIVSALVYAHERGVAHCDIKPSNILLTRDNIPKLTDWGLARAGSSRWSASGYSPRYAAPEQQKSSPECGYATDIWQVGMVLSELLTGQAKIPSGTEAVFSEGEGAALFPVLQKCLATDPRSRYPSARALQEDLDLLLDHQG
jgi:hypothetical protein